MTFINALRDTLTGNMIHIPSRKKLSNMFKSLTQTLTPLTPQTGYRYIGFYGNTGTSNGWMYELELTMVDGSVINYINPIPLDKITRVADTSIATYNTKLECCTTDECSVICCVFDPKFLPLGLI